MTLEASRRHEQLEDLLIQGRMTGALTEASDDAITEEMAEVWYEMSEEEQNQARARIAPYARAMAIDRARKAEVLTSTGASTWQEIQSLPLTPTGQPVVVSLLQIKAEGQNRTPAFSPFHVIGKSVQPRAHMVVR